MDDDLIFEGETNDVYEGYNRFSKALSTMVGELVEEEVNYSFVPGD